MENSIAIVTPQIAKAFQEADDFWQRALELDYGGGASDARYDQRGQGEPGSKLREAADRRHVAYQAWAGAAFGIEG